MENRLVGARVMDSVAGEGVTIKKQPSEGFYGDGTISYLDCGGDYTNLYRG